MKLGSALALLAGLALLVWVLAQSDLGQVAHLLSKLSWAGVGWIVALFVVTWAAEILAWALTFIQRPVRGPWLWRLWLVNMVGEAMNVAMPFGALGGEPVKAWLLKHRYGIGYRETTTTLVLMQTLLALAEAIFVAVGALLAVALGLLPVAVEQLLSAAALTLMAMMVVSVIGLHQRWLRSLMTRCERRFAGARYGAIKDGLAAVELALAAFVREHGRRFTTSTAFFLVNWLGGAAELWLMMQLLGSPLPFVQCWVAEAAIVSIRSLTFFLPAQLGSVEAVTVYVISALGGGVDIGLALAALRRVREVLWAALGLAVGAGYHFDWRAATRG